MAMMMRVILFAAFVMIAVAVSPGFAADIDRSVADFKTPADTNGSGTRRAPTSLPCCLAIRASRVLT
jgi:hypothetical protein